MVNDESKLTSLKPPMIPLVAKSVPPLTRENSTPPERIMRLVDQARRHKITFISSAEGYGKTTVLTEWYRRLRADEMNVVWFTCDRADVDVERFWMNFHYAVCSGFKNVGVPDFETLSAMALPDAIYTLANSLCVAATQCGGLFIIIERFDVLETGDSIDGLMMLIAALSDDVHLVLSSRKVYSKYDFDNSFISDMPLSLSTEDLAFTKEETVEELCRRLDCVLPDNVIESAYEKTLGWPFALHVLVDSIKASGDAETAIAEFSGTNPQMRDFFEYEVYASLPVHLQQFLMRTSSIGLFNKQLCCYVLDDDEAGACIDELCVRNVFVFPLDANRLRVGRHPLFSDWLISTKMFQLTGVELRRFNSRAAHWTQRHNMPIAAAKHRILASERQDIVDLALTAFPSMSSMTLLSQTFFHRSPDESQVHPAFMLMAAWAYAYAADVVNMRIWSEKVHATAQLTDEVLLSLEVLKVKGLCLECRFGEGIELADQIEQRLKDPNYTPLRIILANCHAEALDQQGMLALGMEKHLTFASLANSDSFAFLGAINQYEMAYSFFEQGRLDRATQACRAIEASTTDDHPVRGAVMALEVMMDVIHGNLAANDDRLEKANRLVSKRRNADMYIDWCVSKAWSLAAMGQFDQADEVLLDAVGVVKMSPNAIPRGTSVLPFQSRAIMRVLRGEVEIAPETYLEFDRLGIPGTAHSSLTRRYVELVSVESDDEREKLLASLLEEAKKFGYRLLVLDLSIDLAWMHYLRGQRTRATRLLHEALEYAAKFDIVSPFLWRASYIRPLLVSYITTVKADYARHAFVQRLLRHSELASTDDAETISMIGLTGREIDILKLAMEGLSRQEIASELCVGDSTVKSHLSHIYSKMGIKGFKELLVVASELGL